MKYDLTGYNIDNLLKTLYSKKITLLNVERPSQTHVKFELKDKHDKKAKKYIANFNGKNTPSFLKNLPKFILSNLCVVIAVFIGAIFYLFAGNYIWQIRIFGLKNLTQNEIIQVLAQNGVKKGKLNTKSSQQIETILLENYDRLAQVSVAKQGTTIVINLSEKLVYNEQTFEPITARYSGIITHINLITGTTNVKVGDYVNIGDILVLPFNLDKQGNKVSVKPLAEICARIYVVGSAKLAQTETVLTRTGKTKIVYDYYLFNKHIFSGKNKNSFVFFEDVSYNENVSKLLPFKRTKTCFYELAETQKTYDFEQEKPALIEKSKVDAMSKQPTNCEIVDEISTVEISNNTMYAYTTLTLQGQIND